MSTTTKVKSHSRPFMGTKLQPRQGIPAGIFAGLGMMLVWMLGAQVWGPGADVLLSSIGAVLFRSATPSLMLATGLIIHFVVAILLGLLFAVSLDRLSNRDVLIVSTFYGFTIWIVAVFILRHWVHVEAVQMSRSWWGFFTFLVFGFLLGVYANKFGAPPAEE